MQATPDTAAAPEIPTTAQLSHLNHQQLTELARKNLLRSEQHAHIAFLALVEVKQRGSWYPQYRTLAAYIQAEMQVGVSHSYRIIDQIEIYLNLHSSQNGNTKLFPGGEVIPEGHTRILAELPAEQQAEAYEMAQVLAGEEEVQERHVREAVDSFANIPPEEKPEEQADQGRSTAHRCQSPAWERVYDHVQDAILSLKRVNDGNTNVKDRRTTLLAILTLALDARKMVTQENRQAWVASIKEMRKKT